MEKYWMKHLDWDTEYVLLNVVFFKDNMENTTDKKHLMQYIIHNLYMRVVLD